jgi:hypothetical protein
MRKYTGESIKNKKNCTNVLQNKNNSTSVLQNNNSRSVLQNKNNSTNVLQDENNSSMFYTIWNRLYSCLFVPGKLEREKIRYWKSRNTVPVEEDARLYTVKMHDRGRHTYHSIAALTTERIQHYLRIECKATGQWGHHHPIHSEVYKSAKVGIPLKSSANR